MDAQRAERLVLAETMYAERHPHLTAFEYQPVDVRAEFFRVADVILGAGFRRVPEDAAAQVREFHVAFNLPIGDSTRTLNKLRADLIREEGREAATALEVGDLEHIAKELADLVYVTYGAALTLGIDLDAAVTAVHESNMSKLVDGKPVMRPDGKVLKGHNYRPPDMARCVLAAVRGGSVSGGGDNQEGDRP